MCGPPRAPLLRGGSRGAREVHRALSEANLGRKTMTILQPWTLWSQAPGLVRVTDASASLLGPGADCSSADGGSRELGYVHGDRDGMQALPGQDSDLHPDYRSRCVTLRVCGAGAAIVSKPFSSDSRLSDMPYRHPRCRRNDSASFWRTKRELSVIRPRPWPASQCAL